MISQRHEEHGVDLRVDDVLPCRDKAERASAASEDWDGLLDIRILSGDPSGRREQKEQHDAGQDNSLQSAGPGFSAGKRHSHPLNS